MLLGNKKLKIITEKRALGISANYPDELASVCHKISSVADFARLVIYPK